MEPAEGADDDLDAICDRVERLDEDLTRLGRATEQHCRADYCRHPNPQHPDPDDPFVGNAADPVLLPVPLDPPRPRARRRPVWWRVPLVIAAACALVVAVVLLAALG